MRFTTRMEPPEVLLMLLGEILQVKYPHGLASLNWTAVGAGHKDHGLDPVGVLSRHVDQCDCSRAMSCASDAV